MAELICKKCGNSNPGDATFCGGCGASLLLMRQPKAGERKPGFVDTEPPPGITGQSIHRAPQTPQYQTPPPAHYQAPAPGQYEEPTPQQFGVPSYAPVFENQPDTTSWTFAGCLPFGWFAFMNGSFMWGCFAWLPFLAYIYPIYIGIKGRELAWQNRAYSDPQEFEKSMRTYNIAGLVFLVVQFIIGIIIGFISVIEEAANPANY